MKFKISMFGVAFFSLAILTVSSLGFDGRQPVIGRSQSVSRSVPLSAFSAARPPLSRFDQLSEIIACDNAFDNALTTSINNDTSCLNNCETQHNTCVTNCAGQQQCITTCNNQRDSCEGSCGTTFGSSFGDNVHDYTECLLAVEFTLDMCANANAAAQDCLYTRNSCEAAAQTSEQLGDCAVGYWECYNASGIDQCQ